MEKIMSLSICEKFSNINLADGDNPLPYDTFHAKLKDVAERVGLRKSYVDQIREWAVEANQENYPENKKIAFAELFTPNMERVAGAVINRSCFIGKPLSDQQIRIDIVHYACLRAFDEIFGAPEEPYRKWVDQSYDQGILTATEAILILNLMQRTVRSLMKCKHDESHFSYLLGNLLRQKEAAIFAEGLILSKCDFPIRDAEIVLFTEIVHTLFKRPCENRRALFKGFLEGFQKTFRGFNAETKDIYFTYVEDALLRDNKVPEVTRHVQPVPKIKLEANRYFFLRLYDTAVENCRSCFAQKVDSLFDQGYLTYSAANELLDLVESPRRWTSFNLAQQLMILQEKHHWDFDISILKKPFLASVER